MKRPIHKDYQPYLYETKGGDLPYDYPYSEDPESQFYRLWVRETERCINGYDPGGGLTPLPGRLYFHLNHSAIPISIGAYEYIIPPYYRDLEHEYTCFLEDECFPRFDANGEFIKPGATAVVPKSRDKGFTMTNISIGNVYEFTFFPNSHNLIGTGNDTEMVKCKDVLKTIYFHVSPPFRHRLMESNTNYWKSGMQEEVLDSKGRIIDYKITGNQSFIHFRDNFNRKIDAANSLRVKFALIDESGLINRLLKIHAKNEAVFNRGIFQYACVVYGGTSKAYEAKDTDYEVMFERAKDLGFKTFFIPAHKALHPFINYETGKSDELKAREEIQKKYDKAAAISFEQLQLVQQEYPTIPEHCFLKKASQYLPHDIIDRQINRIVTHPDFDEKGLNDYPEIEIGRLEWVREVGGEVEWIPDPKGKIKILRHPYHLQYKGEHYKYAEIGAVDSYNKEETVESDSMGSLHVYRRFTELSREYSMPTIEYVDRPNHTEYIFRGKENEEMLVKKDIWYDNCHKIAVYCGIELLVEDSDEEFFRFFRKRKALHCLARTPKLYKSNSRVVKDYMINVDDDVKVKMTDLLDQNLTTHPENIWFLHLLRELRHWQMKNTDRGISYSLCLLFDSDLNSRKKAARKVETNVAPPPPKAKFERRNGKMYIAETVADNGWDDWFEKGGRSE